MPLVNDYVKIKSGNCCNEDYLKILNRIEDLCKIVKGDEKLTPDLLDFIKEIDELVQSALEYNPIIPECIEGISSSFKEKFNEYVSEVACNDIEKTFYYLDRYELESTMEEKILYQRILNKRFPTTTLECIKDICEKLGWVIFPIENFSVSNLIIHDEEIVKLIKEKYENIDKTIEEYKINDSFGPLKKYVLAPFDYLDIISRIKDSNITFNDVYFSEKLIAAKKMLEMNMWIYCFLYEEMSRYMSVNESWKNGINNTITKIKKDIYRIDLDMEELGEIQKYKQELKKINCRLEKIKCEEKCLQIRVDIKNKEYADWSNRPPGRCDSSADYNRLSSGIEDSVFTIGYNCYNYFCIIKNQEIIEDLLQQKQDLENKIEEFKKRKNNGYSEGEGQKNSKLSNQNSTGATIPCLNDDMLSPMIFFMSQSIPINDAQYDYMPAHLGLCFGNEIPESYFEDCGLQKQEHNAPIQSLIIKRK